MQKKKLTERIERGEALLRELKILFPHPKMALNYSNNWELLVAVMLSAQCTDVRVNIVTKDLFKKYRTLADYAHANIAEFEKDIFSTGFYKNKAKHVIASANKILDTFDGEVPSTMHELLTLPGVARKTTNVVLGNAFGIVEGIAVDTHVRRFALKFDLTDRTNPVHIEKDLMLVFPENEWFRLTYRLIEYGRHICPARKHACEEHPLSVLYPQASNIWPKAH